MNGFEIIAAAAAIIGGLIYSSTEGVAHILGGVLMMGGIICYIIARVVHAADSWQDASSSKDDEDPRKPD